MLFLYSKMFKINNFYSSLATYVRIGRNPDVRRIKRCIYFKRNIATKV